MPNRKCKLESNHEESPSDPESPTNADGTTLCQPANQGDSQPQEVIVTSPAEPLLRKTTSRTNLEIAIGANPFQIKLMEVTSQSKEVLI